MPFVEFGHNTLCPPFQGAKLAVEAEELGFDACYFGDNTCFVSDPFAELRAAAEATTTIKLATGCTNTVTRHPSTVATSIAAVQVLSGGRAICGLCTGDSAMAVIGRGPQRHAEFIENAELLRSYLAGESIQLGTWESRIEWLKDFDYEPVPLEIMCSGPRTLRSAAALADRITLAVGSAPERIRWALDVIDEGLDQAGRTRGDVQIGAFVQICVDDDRVAAADRLRNRVKGVAHMASFPGIDLDAQPEILRRATSRLRAEYDYRYLPIFNRDANPNADLVDSEFAEWFGIGGSHAYVIERLSELAEMGVGFFLLSGLPMEEVEDLAAAVLPEVRKLQPGGGYSAVSAR